MRISDWSSDVCSSDLVNYDVDFTDLDEDGDVAFTSNGGWIGFTDKYWLSALIPDQKAPVSAKFRKGADDLYQADFSLEPALLAPGKTVSQTSRLFVGAKETKLLERRSEEHTSELQSLMRISYAVFCLKKKKHKPNKSTTYII